MLVEARPAQHFAEDLQQFRHVPFRHQAVQRRQFPAGMGVDLAAHGLQAQGQAGAVQPGGAFEEQVFEKMGIAGLRHGFMAHAVEQP